VIQRRTLASGAVLGIALLSALTVAGIMGARDTPRQVAAAPPSPATDAGTRTVTQPALQQALLKPADLPSPYVTASKATVRRVAEQQPERCSALLDPASLVRQASAQVLTGAEATDQASTHLDGAAQLTQLLTTFAGDGAEATLRELREVGKQCKSFDASLDDGTPVKVTAEPVHDDASTYTLKLTFTGGGQVKAGYVTLGRVGRVISVLRELGTVEAVGGLDPVRLVDLTLSRLTKLD
jgi:hypothetical protein